MFHIRNFSRAMAVVVTTAGLSAGLGVIAPAANAASMTLTASTDSEPATPASLLQTACSDANRTLSLVSKATKSVSGSTVGVSAKTALKLCTTSVTKTTVTKVLVKAKKHKKGKKAKKRYRTVTRTTTTVSTVVSSQSVTLSSLQSSLIKVTPKVGTTTKALINGVTTYTTTMTATIKVFLKGTYTVAATLVTRVEPNGSVTSQITNIKQT